MKTYLSTRSRFQAAVAEGKSDTVTVELDDIASVGIL